jgi:hypothetical protein
MQLAFKPARLTGFAILAVAGATALSVGACSSHNDKSSEKSSAASANGQESVSGLIASVSGSTVKVTQESGTATVEFSPQTKFQALTGDKLSSVADGNCVAVWTTPPAGGGDVIATAVRRVLPVAGKCPQAPTGPGDKALRGTVASVTGDRITVTGADDKQTAVAVDDKTWYTQVGVSNAKALAQGKCISASGATKDGHGALQAAQIVVTPASNSKC